MFFDLTPPLMISRAIAPEPHLPGVTTEVPDGDVKFTLYLPEGYRPKPEGVTLTIHFHGAPWFAIQEHLRRPLDGPLIAFHNGEGSSVYRKPFLDHYRLRRWTKLVEARIGAPVRRVDISSFSAGYGAVREIVKQPEYRRLIHRIVLADSMYAGYSPIFPGARTRRPTPEDIDPWQEFVQMAARGEKQFALTHSQVPTDTYANSVACARWIAMFAGTREAVVNGGTGRYPLLTRVDVGGLHIWGYGGTDAGAHVVHARHIADVWRQLDATGN